MRRISFLVGLLVLLGVRADGAPRVASRKDPVVLSKLWGASKKQVALAMRGNKLTERYQVEQSNPDRMVRGGEVRVYALGGSRELSAWFNRSGHVVSVSVESNGGDGLGRTLDQWPELFREYGLPECGKPAQTAPAAYIWGPPHNRTGGFEIRLVASDVSSRRVWQVQVRSPEEFRK